MLSNLMSVENNLTITDTYASTDIWRRISHDLKGISKEQDEEVRGKKHLPSCIGLSNIMQLLQP
jgi:sensor histidine kinase YesM